MDKLINYEKLSEFKNKLLNDNVASPKATWSSKKITTHINAELANYATTTSVDASLANKADKSYVDASLALKADKSYVDSSLALKQNLLSAGQNIAIDASNNISAEGYVFDETKGSFAEKYFDDDNNVFVANIATGIGSHAEGFATTATGDYGAHAEGYDTKATYTAEGGYNHGVGAHAEGWGTEAKHDGAHAEGVYTLASAQGAHAEGSGAQNELVQALGMASHAEGIKTIARNRGEHAEGFKNVSHTSGSQTADSSANTAHSVGVGTNDLRRNAEEIMYNGDMYVFGIGNYDGIHIKNEQGAPAGLQTLQEVIANKANVYEVATTADINALFNPPTPTQPNDEIWYRTSDGQPIQFVPEGMTEHGIISNTYANGKGILKFSNTIISLEEGMLGNESIYHWDGGDEPGQDIRVYNDNLTDVWLPNSVTHISTSAIQYIYEQNNHTLNIHTGSGINYINPGAFSIDSGWFDQPTVNVYIETSTPPMLGYYSDGVFSYDDSIFLDFGEYGEPIWNVYVPTGSKSVYTSTITVDPQYVQPGDVANNENSFWYRNSNKIFEY